MSVEIITQTRENTFKRERESNVIPVFNKFKTVIKNICLRYLIIEEEICIKTQKNLSSFREVTYKELNR